MAATRWSRRWWTRGRFPAGSAVSTRSARGSATAGVLEIGGCDTVELAREFGTPAYVYDEDDMRERARATRAAFAQRTERFEVLYASKAFPCTAALRIFDEEGLSFDVASGGELHLALAAGVDPARIYMHGNNKTDAELEEAVAAGIGHVIVDSIDEIDRLERIAAGREQKVLVRVTPGHRARDPPGDPHRPGGLEVRHPDARGRAGARARGGGGPRAARAARPHRLAGVRPRRVRVAGGRAAGDRRLPLDQPRRRLRGGVHARGPPAGARPSTPRRCCATRPPRPPCCASRAARWSRTPGSRSTRWAP